MLRINVLGGLSVVSDRRPEAIQPQPRRLAVLAVLALAGERGATRDELLTLLWPENDEEHGRHALTQALYALRRDLDADQLFLGQQELRLNPDLVTSDWDEFHRALRDSQPERAVACYRGPFLDRFQIPRVDNFQRWVEEQRGRLEQEFGRALEAAARQAADRGDVVAAIVLLRRRAAQDPCNPRVAVRLMETLAANGEVVEALQHARAYEARVKAEFDLPPDPSVTALAARLRSPSQPGSGHPEPERSEGAGSLISPAATSGIPRSPGDLGMTDPPDPSSRAKRGIPGLAVVVVLAAILLAAFYLRPHGQSAATARPVIAVGWIANYGARDGSGLGPAVGDMLATNLSRGTGYRVISNGRMMELARQIRATGDSSDLTTRAARQAGATQLVDGALYTLAPNRYRLDLRRVDLSSGAVIDSYTAEGADLFTLVDSGTVQLAPDLGGSPPRGSVAEVATRSVPAYERYHEGLRHYYDGDLLLAERDFQDALQLDSTFVLAWFYYARSYVTGPAYLRFERLRRAVLLSSRASDRDRLVIQAEWALWNRSPNLLAIADTLRIRYPEEVDGHAYLAQGALMLGRYTVAESAFKRLIRFDSLGIHPPTDGRCLSCEGYGGLSFVYGVLDSQRLMGATIREWVRRQPGNPSAWRAMSTVFTVEGQLDAALKAIRVADSIEPGSPLNRWQLFSVTFNFERYAEAERFLRSEMSVGTYATRPKAQWSLAVLLRQLGRLEEALALAHDHRLLAHEDLLPGAAPYDALLEGQILFELGRYREAAALFDSVAVGVRAPIDSSLRYGARIWAWVHSADACARLGDTTRLRLLADTMEILGRNVAFSRDQRLHAYVRGLLARLQGRDDEALRWFEQAMTTPTLGFTRINYELAALYLKRGRARDAVRVLEGAYRGGTVDSNLYITRTDIEQRLAQAFEAAHQTDSALVYYRRVASAWNGGDEMFRPRRDSVEAAVVRLGGVRSEK